MSQVQELMKKLNKEYGENIISYGVNSDNFKKIKRIPFSSPRANYMTYGGLPRGRLIEFAGAESSGKTTTSLDIVANAQTIFKQEYDEVLSQSENMKSLSASAKEKLHTRLQIGCQKVLYIDAENTLDLAWAEMLGVDLNDIYLYSPQRQCAEEIFEDAYNLIKTGEIGLCILDSLGVLLSGQAYEKSLEEKTYAGISKPLTTFANKVAPLCAEFDTTFIGINQVRDNLNSPYGGLVTTGGRGWKHNCSVRIMFRKGDFVNDVGEPIKKSSENPCGNRVEMDIQKSKSFRSDRRIGYYTLNYMFGVEATQDLFEIAMKYDYIKKGGAWYTFRNPKTGEDLIDEEGNLLKVQGARKVLQRLDEDPDIRGMIENAVNELIFDFDNKVNTETIDEENIEIEHIFEK